MAASRAAIHGHSGKEPDPVSVTGLVTAAGADCGKVAGAKAAGWAVAGVGGGKSNEVVAVLAAVAFLGVGGVRLAAAVEVPAAGVGLALAVRVATGRVVVAD